MPSIELFQQQPASYRNRVLPPGVPLLAVEAGLPLGWQSYLGSRIRAVGVKRFGASAPGGVVMQAYGLTADHVYRQAQALLQSPADLGNHLLVAMNDDQDSLDLVRHVAECLPDPAETEVTLIHYLAPMVWVTGIGDGDGEWLAYDWDQVAKLEKMEADITQEVFDQARDILQKAGVAAVHIHAKMTPVPFPSVTQAVLDALEEGLYSAVVVGRHHHHALTRLLRRDPGAAISKQARGVTVWVVEQ